MISETSKLEISYNKRQYEILMILFGHPFIIVRTRAR